MPAIISPNTYRKEGEMRKFMIRKKMENIRPSYKALQDVQDLKIKSFLTISQLRKEFLMTPLKITSMLRDAKVWPVGKIFKRDPDTQDKLKGKPELAYDPEEARKAIREAIK